MLLINYRNNTLRAAKLIINMVMYKYLGGFYSIVAITAIDTIETIATITTIETMALTAVTGAVPAHCIFPAVCCFLFSGV